MDKILTLKQLAESAGGFLLNCDENIYAADVVTDSRKIGDGAVFVALRGEKFDGHNALLIKLLKITQIFL